MSNESYEQWRNEELKATEEAWLRYRNQGIRHQASGIRQSFTISIAAAVLILALGTGLWLKRDKIFGPSERQLTENYEQTVKALSLYSQSLTKSFDHLKTLKLGDDPDGTLR